MAAADPTPSRPLLLIPGPIEYSSAVLNTLAQPTLSHVSPAFIKDFQSALKALRVVLGLSGPPAQPFVLSGSGTLGWDFILANCVERGQKVLVVNTGYFSDSFADCAQTYGIEVVQIKAAEIGDTVPLEAIKAKLQSDKDIRMVLLTQVDTSTAVKNDVAAMAAAAKEVSPDVLVTVDGVCSIGGERFHMDDMRIDAVLTCSQKALGCPPGLCIVALNQRAMAAWEQRKSPVPAYFISLKNWLPVMRAYENGDPSYFATPNVNLVRALNASLQEILSQGLEQRFALHEWRSRAFKAAVTALGLQQVPRSPQAAANTLTAIYFPQGVEAPKLLNELKENGIIAAGGLHKEIKTKYFRVGCMGLSVSPHRSDMDRAVEAIEKSLAACGVKIAEPGKAVEVFRSFPAPEAAAKKEETKANL